MFYNKQNFKRKAFASIILTILALGIFLQIPGLYNNFLTLKGNEDHFSRENAPQASETDYYNKEWITNGDFSSGSVNWSSETLGDTSDLNLGISSGVANYEVKGEKKTFSLNEDPLVGSNWLPVPNPDFPGLVDYNSSDSEGLIASHTFHDQGDANQNPSIHWDRNFTMPVDMSDYEIISASMQSVVYARVSKDVDVDGDNLAAYYPDYGYPGLSLDQRASYDYVRFYVLISDLSRNKVYEIAYLQPTDLGQGDPEEYSIVYDEMTDTYLITVPEDILIFYLTSVLNSDNYNFTITLGIRIYAADNAGNFDYDRFTELRFKSLDLTFTYEKKINQLDRGSWKQNGDLIPDNYVIENATLNFKYMINASWSEYASSPNSEFRILINNNQLGETINLDTANETLRDIKSGGFDVTQFISSNKQVNLTIQVYIGDEFLLNSTVKISIDDVSLIIGYGIETPPDLSDFELILNDVDKTTEKSTQVTFNENLNITLVYKDSNGDFISGADVELIGGGLDPITLLPNGFDNYFTEINSSDLGVGMTYLTLTASKRYHTTVQFQITIEVVNRDTELQLYLDKSNQTIDKEWKTTWNENLNITIKYLDIDNTPATHISGATVDLTGVGATKPLIEDSGNKQYEISINTFDIGVGSTYLTVYASQENYTSLNIRFKIIVTTRDTYLDNIKLDNIERTSFEIAWNEIFDISASYNDTDTGNFISGASLQLIGTDYTDDFTPSGESYSLSVNTTELTIGNNFLTILAQKSNYSIFSKLITITVTERATTMESILNHTSATTISYPHGELLNITAIYSDESGPFIDDATVQLREGSTVVYNLTEYSSPNQYSVEINTDELNLGVNLLTLYAKKENYSAAFISLTIIVDERDVSLDIILDSNPSTVIDAIYDEYVNITAIYRDFKDLFIAGATVELISGGDEYVMSKHSLYDQYNISINTQTLNLGTNLLTIRASKENYSSIFVGITINVLERNTDYKIYLDGIDYTANPAIPAYPDQSINLTVSYIDSITTQFISGAIVDVNGSGISEPLDEVYNNYTVILDTSNLNTGFNFLTIYARKEGYASQSITLAIQIIPIETELKLYLDGVDRTSSPSLTTYTNQLINLTVSYIDSIATQFISGATVDVNGSGISEPLNEVYNNYTYTIDTNELNFGANFLTIYARKEGYEPQSIVLTVQIVQIETELKLYLDGVDKTSSPAITTYTNQLINLTVSYREDISTTFISGATVDVNGSGISELLDEVYNNYTYIIDTSELNFGANFLTIYARKEGYEPQSIILTVQIVQIETILDLYIDGVDKTSNPAINAYTNQLINLTVSYREDISATFISGATVDVNGSGISELLDEVYNNYTYTIDTSELNFGANFLTIYARKNGYEPQSIILTVQVVQIETVLDLYIDGVDRTSNPAITTYTNEFINLTVSYREDISTTFISGATVDVNGSSISELLDEVYNNYTLTIDTSELNFGANFLTIYARKNGYEPQSIILTVQVVQIETVLDLYIDGVDKTSNPAITTYNNQFINLTVSYREDISTMFISGATVDVNGSSISELLDEVYNNYTLMIDTSDLNFGANFLTIYARKDGYEPQSIILTVQIVQIETVLDLYIDDTDKTSNPAITTYPDQLINLTVSYKELISTLFISGATLDVNGSGISEPLNEVYNNYTYTIDTSKLNFGANFLTIYARKEGYEPRSIILTIQIVQIETVLNLYLDDTDKTLNPALTTYPDQFINLTVSYKEAFSKAFISEATVDVNGSDVSGVSEILVESHDNYTIIIDTSELRLGANFLTIYARKEGYEPQSIIITVQIIQIETGVNLTLNGNPTTFLTIPIRKLLNITVNYFEVASETAITDATIQLIGGGISSNLIENAINHQYSIVIDTGQLDPGGKLFTIYCNRTNYQPYSANLKIQVDRIRTNITTSTGDTLFNFKPGDNFQLKVNLTDLDFNAKVLNATVTYTWDYGQGDLTDENNDGVYEGTISNLREGTFVVTISVYAGDDYEFERFTVTLNVVRPPEEVLLFQVLTIVGIGAAIGLGGYLFAYQKVLKYPKQVRKIRKYKSKLKKRKSLGIETRSRDQIIEDNYAEKIHPLEKTLKSKMGMKAEIEKEPIEKPQNN